jgi:hypothetical protein
VASIFLAFALALLALRSADFDRAEIFSVLDGAAGCCRGVGCAGSGAIPVLAVLLTFLGRLAKGWLGSCSFGAGAALLLRLRLPLLIGRGKNSSTCSKSFD